MHLFSFTERSTGEKRQAEYCEPSWLCKGDHRVLLDCRSKPGSCGKGHNTFYGGDFPLKNKYLSTNTGFGNESFCWAMEAYPRFGLLWSPRLLEFLFGLLIKGQPREWIINHWVRRHRFWIFLTWLWIEGIYWIFLVLLVCSVCLLNPVSKGYGWKRSNISEENDERELELPSQCSLNFG